MRNRVSWVLVCLLGLAAFSAAKAGQPGEFVSILAGKKPIEGKTYACFARTYDPAYYSTHHFQRVTAVRMLVAIDSVGDYGFQLRLGLNVRDRADALSTGAECTGTQTPARADQPAICAGATAVRRF